MALPDIVLRITEPETEWIRGRPLQKVSPTRSHALLQGTMLTILRAWGGSAAEVGAEWRFRVTPPGKAARPLVPDVAYVATERLRGKTGDELEVPHLSPDVAVEVLSPDDRRPDVDDKIATYLSAGSTAVIVVDPKHRTVELHGSGGKHVFGLGETAMHPTLPGLAIAVSELFDTIAPP